jgi:hypothetical protein
VSPDGSVQRLIYPLPVQVPPYSVFAKVLFCTASRCARRWLRLTMRPHFRCSRSPVMSPPEFVHVLSVCPPLKGLGGCPGSAPGRGLTPRRSPRSRRWGAIARSCRAFFVAAGRAFAGPDSYRGDEPVATVAARGLAVGSGGCEEVGTFPRNVSTYIGAFCLS